MYAFAKRVLLAALRVPHDPVPPAGSPDSIRTFHAGERFYHWNLFYWALLQLLTAFGLFVVFGISLASTRHIPAWLRAVEYTLETFAFIGFLAQLPFTFWKQKLDYEMRWYMVTDRSLRIRAGLWSVQEITMTFANIQKIEVQQGPLQKLLGLATVEVTSAGGGSGAAQQGKGPERDEHAARFEGVDNAGEIRDLILERLRRYRDAGLGDTPVEEAHPAADADQQAAAEVLEAARALRLAVEASR